MKANFLCLFILLGTMICCEPINVPDDIDGHYIGTFKRGRISSNVKLTLEGNSFSGESDAVKFPAICHGNYAISNKTIKFENQCAWTAEFDWSLILNDTWNYSFVDNKLILTNSIEDIYSLTKQK